MHYKNGREAKVGDLVIGLTYNRTGPQVGRVKTIKTSPNPEEVKTCNVTLELPGRTPWNSLDEDYTQCDWLLRADDVWAFVIGVRYSPNDQDYMAKILNFDKWNAPTPELPLCEEFSASLPERKCQFCGEPLEYHATEMNDEGVVVGAPHWRCPSCKKVEGIPCRDTRLRKMRDALEELVDIVDNARDTIDSFTTQPAKHALASVPANPPQAKRDPLSLCEALENLELPAEASMNEHEFGPKHCTNPPQVDTTLEGIASELRGHAAELRKDAYENIPNSLDALAKSLLAHQPNPYIDLHVGDDGAWVELKANGKSFCFQPVQEFGENHTWRRHVLQWAKYVHENPPVKSQPATDDCMKVLLTEERHNELLRKEKIADGKSQPKEGVSNRLKQFIAKITLELQTHRSLRPDQLDAIFQESYRWYCELDCENRAAESAAVPSMEANRINKAFNMAADAAFAHDEINRRFWWLIEGMKSVPPVHVYPCQSESGSPFFTVSFRGERFTGSTVEEAIDKAMEKQLIARKEGGKLTASTDSASPSASSSGEQSPS